MVAAIPGLNLGADAPPLDLVVGLVATASRVVNAIPAVIDAAPGIVTTLDLPLVTGHGLYAG